MIRLLLIPCLAFAVGCSDSASDLSGKLAAEMTVLRGMEDRLESTRSECDAKLAKIESDFHKEVADIDESMIDVQRMLESVDDVRVGIGYRLAEKLEKQRQDVGIQMMSDIEATQAECQSAVESMRERVEKQRRIVDELEAQRDELTR